MAEPFHPVRPPRVWTPGPGLPDRPPPEPAEPPRAWIPGPGLPDGPLPDAVEPLRRWTPGPGLPNHLPSDHQPSDPAGRSRAWRPGPGLPDREPDDPLDRPREWQPRPGLPDGLALDVLLIDNYDSFVHNLARYIRELGARTRVVRNDAIDVETVARLAPTHIVLSPGPCTPREAGISNAVIAALGATTPILGVCLGHQCIGEVYGGLVTRAPRPMHGKTSLVFHEARGIFRGLPSPFVAARYHSLVVEPGSVPPDLEVLATTAEGDVMAFAHRRHPVVGVQFHPESVLTEHGYRILANFLSCEVPEPEPAAR